ncbi:MAG TPA: ABC transporter substrate-binding protein [Candidatus Binatia bacterium]|jgi:NitT/TauT family transport system substrate-binding protein
MFRLIVALALTLLPSLSNQADAQTIKMTIGQTGINPGTGPFIIAQKEKFFAKHGLEVKVIETTTTSAVQAILGGSMQLTMGAGPAFTSATLEGAPPFVNIASWINVFPYYLVARKEVTKIAELKGKTGQVGGPFGAAPDVALRFGLSKLGIDPEKDVKFVQMARPDWINVIAQLEKGDVQFSVLPPPFDRIGEKHGIRALYALPDLGIQWQQNGEWVLKSSLASNREAILRVERALAEAMTFYFNQKEKTLAYLVDFLGTSREDTEYSYSAYAKWADKIPRPKLDSIKTTLQAISRTTLAAAKADPASFIDVSIIDQLLKEGYFKY